MSNSFRQAAEAILNTMREQFRKPHTVIAADQNEFRHLDLNAYSAFQADLKLAAFIDIGDVEILEVSNSPTTLIARTMIRNMLSDDGHILAQYYQVKPRIGRRLMQLFRGLSNLRFVAAPKNFAHGMITRHCVGFETEFDDGRQLITSNAEAAGLISGPTSIECKYFPYGTSVKALLEHHRARVTVISLLTKPVHLCSLDSVLEMQKRQNMLKVAHRTAESWITQGELQNMLGNEEASRAIFAEIQKLVSEERTSV